MKINRSVTHYITGYANVKIYFSNFVACINCRFCRYEQGSNRYFCRLDPLGRQIIDPRDSIEGFCPIDQFEEEQT